MKGDALLELDPLGVLQHALVRKVVAERGDVDAHELELGRQVGRVHLARSVTGRLGEVEREDRRHLDAGTDQAVRLRAFDDVSTLSRGVRRMRLPLESWMKERDARSLATTHTRRWRTRPERSS